MEGNKNRRENDDKIAVRLNELLIDESVILKKIDELSSSSRHEMAENLGDAYDGLSRIVGRNGGKFEEKIGDYKIIVDEVDKDFFSLGSRVFRFKLFQKGKEVISKKGSYDKVFDYYYAYSLVLKGVRPKGNLRE